MLQRVVMSKSVECYRDLLWASLLSVTESCNGHGMSVECYRELLWASVDCRVKAFW